MSPHCLPICTVSDKTSVLILLFLTLPIKYAFFSLTAFKIVCFSTVFQNFNPDVLWYSFIYVFLIGVYRASWICGFLGYRGLQ